MNVQLHPDIDSLDKESLCYSIYSQLYHNFFNVQQKKDDDHPYGVEEGDETSIRLKNTAYGFASAIAGAVAGEGAPVMSPPDFLRYSSNNPPSPGAPSPATAPAMAEANP